MGVKEAAFNKNKKWGTQILPEKFKAFQKEIVLKKQNTPVGYLLWFVHPLTQKIWSISQRGVIEKGSK